MTDISDAAGHSFGGCPLSKRGYFLGGGLVYLQVAAGWGSWQLEQICKKRQGRKRHWLPFLVLKRRQICGLEVDSLGVALGVEGDCSGAKVQSKDRWCSLRQ